jgi:AraC family ethanolamine operon transcriptional activator
MASLNTEVSAKGSILQRNFNDIDEVTEALNALPHRKLRLAQLSLQRFHCKVLLAEFGQAQFIFSDSDTPVRCTGEKFAGYVGMSIVLQSGGQVVTAHGNQWGEDYLAGLDQNREINLVMPANLELCSVQIEKIVFEDCLQIMERSDIDQKFLSKNILYSPATLPTIRAYLTQLKHLLEYQPHLLKLPHLKRLILEDFIPLLIDAIPLDTKPIKPLSVVSRAKLVKQAEDYLLANLDQPITLKDLCQALHVSRNPLFSGFREMFGVSPMEYLKVQRLQGVRRSLKLADPEISSVMIIAQGFGFWSAGHFARDYKTMFGELPSETLKQ